MGSTDSPPPGADNKCVTQDVKLQANVATRSVLKHSQKTAKSFLAGAPPRTPQIGACNTPLDNIIGWGRGNLLLIPHLFDSFGVSSLGACGASTKHTRRTPLL